MPRVALLAGVLGLLVAGAARGQTCGVAATALAFGAYQPLSGAAAASTGMVTVTCNPGVVSVAVSYTVQLGAGGSGQVSARGLSGPGSTLGYQIYTDALYTQIWGDGTGGTVRVSDGYLLGVLLPVQRSYTAYGLVPANQRVKVGAYSDSVLVIVTY